MVISRVLAVAKPRGGPELWMIGNYLGRRLLEVDPNSERAVLAPRRRTEFRRGRDVLDFAKRAGTVVCKHRVLVRA
jgi:hypothetical protein